MCFLWLNCMIGQVWVCDVRGQSQPNVPSVPTLQEFFERLVGQSNASSPLKNDDLLKVIDTIAGISAEEVKKSLPAIFAALAHPDDEVKKDAVFALWAVARRPDGADLLKSRIDAIGQSLLSSANPDIRAGEIVTLGSLKPVPLPEVLPVFLTFLKRPDPEAQTQGTGVVFELVHIAPENAEVVAAIQQFLSRQMDSQTRIGVLNALGSPAIKDVKLISSIISSLNDSDVGVKTTAIQALVRIGKPALQQAEPDLQRLAADPKQSPEVENNVQEALRRLHAPPK